MVKTPAAAVAGERFVVFATLAATVLVAKTPVLATPYHWDEVVWIRLAHRLAPTALWQVLPGLHPVLAFGGRPPGFFLTIAALFEVFGTSIWLSHFLVVCFALLGVWSTYLLGRLLYGSWVGILAALWLFFDPLYFAQSAMFLADLPVAALGVTTVYLALRKRYVPYVLCALYLTSFKESALAIVFAIAAYVLLTERSATGGVAFRRCLRYAAPLLMMAAYYTWQKAVEGTFFTVFPPGIARFQYSVAAALRQLPFVTRSLFTMQGRWVFSVLIVGVLIARGARHARKEWALFLLIFICSGYTFCVLYFLPRYVLPCAPYFFILAAWALTTVVRGNRLRVLASAALLAGSIAGSLWPRLQGNGEWNMSYLDVVVRDKEVCDYIATHFPDRTVLTTWPYTEYLKHPEFGYTSEAVTVVPFTRAAAVVSADLILLCSPPDALHKSLQDYATARDARQVVRFDRHGSSCELFDGRVQ